MGNFSRSKGRREEQQLVLYLAKLGYQAERILRQYQAAGQPDVKATKDGKTITFEKKARRASFKAIYDLYAQEKDNDGTMCFVTHSFGTPVAVSTDFPSLLTVDRLFRNLTAHPVAPKKMKVFLRIEKLKELKQSADFLVIKDNGKPQLFLRYW